MICINDRRVVTTVLALITVARASAQRPPSVLEIPDGVACASCQITTRALAKLVVPRDSTDGFPTTVRLDPQARYWVFRRGDMPAVFDSAGQFIRTVGRHGRGPGEFLQPYDAVAFRRDSLIVLDGDGRRATVLAPSLRPVRYLTIPFEMHSPIVVSWPDTIIASGIVPTAGEVGWALHRVSFSSKDAAVTKSFGTGDGELRPEGVARMWHWLTPAAGGFFWSAWMYGYTLSQWRANGSLIRSLQRRPEWFPSPSPSSLGNPETPPPPFVVGVQQDDDGLLWVFVHVPAPEWRKAWPTLPPGTREVPSRMIAKEKLFRTTVEVIDPRLGRVVARKTLESFVVGGLQGRRVAVYEVGADGEQHISVLALDLVRH